MRVAMCRGTSVFTLLLACGGSEPVAPPPPPPPPPPATLFRLTTDRLPSSVAAGRSMEARAVDIDRDGDLDLVIAREAEPDLILVNDGTGRFLDESAGRLPQRIRDSEDIATGDLDGDGDVDLVIVAEDDIPGTSGPKHQVYFNDGAGRFTDASSAIPVASTANAVSAGDIDRDGDLDLVLGNEGPEIVLLNDGRGQFAVGAGRVEASGDVTQDVLLADVDRDGDLDLLVVNEAGGPNRLHRNDGRGFFTVVTDAIPGRPEPEATRNADFGDVDGDGDLDLVFANVTFFGGNPASRLLLNDGTGRFTDVTGDRFPRLTIPAIDLDFADLDGDRDLDLVMSSFTSAPYRAFRNDGTGRFEDATAEWLPNGIGGQGVEVEAADFTGDGKLDLYFANYLASPDHFMVAG